jgi:hypothetical protein
VIGGSKSPAVNCGAADADNRPVPWGQDGEDTVANRNSEGDVRLWVHLPGDERGSASPVSEHAQREVQRSYAPLSERVAAGTAGRAEQSTPGIVIEQGAVHMIARGSAGGPVPQSEGSPSSSSTSSMLEYLGVK